MYLHYILIALMMAIPSSDDSSRLEIHVSARTGSDEKGKGNVAAPFRSITKALQAVQAGEAQNTRIVLDVGTYSTEYGESFPLILEPGIHLKGLVVGATILKGDDNSLLIQARGGEPATLIENLTLQDAETGIRFLQDAALGGRFIANGLQMRSMTCGMDVRGGQEPAGATIELSLSSIRVLDCSEGLTIQGEGAIEAHLKDASFNKNRIGVLLNGDTSQGKGVHHTLVFKDCLFSEHEIAGILRRGSDGKNRAVTPYQLEDCIFRGNKIGLHFELPAGDSPIEIAACSFLENTSFGLRIVGQEGAPSNESVIRDSTFLWNGVGMQVTSIRGVYSIRRNRIMDNLGNGIFCGNILAEPIRMLFSDNLIGHNGASGIYCLTDGRNLHVQCVNNTIVSNGSYGLHCHNKHGGASTYDIRNSIFFGNREDMAWIQEESVSNCHMGGGQFVDVNQNLGGNPGFANPSKRDYRLVSTSPCRDKGKDIPEAASKSCDLDGQQRRVGPIDLGAFEYQDFDAK